MGVEYKALLFLEGNPPRHGAHRAATELISQLNPATVAEETGETIAFCHKPFLPLCVVLCRVASVASPGLAFGICCHSAVVPLKCLIELFDREDVVGTYAFCSEWMVYMKPFTYVSTLPVRISFHESLTRCLSEVSPVGLSLASRCTSWRRPSRHRLILR